MLQAAYCSCNSESVVQGGCIKSQGCCRLTLCSQCHLHQTLPASFMQVVSSALARAVPMYSNKTFFPQNLQSKSRKGLILNSWIFIAHKRLEKSNCILLVNVQIWYIGRLHFTGAVWVLMSQISGIHFWECIWSHYVYGFYVEALKPATVKQIAVRTVWPSAGARQTYLTIGKSPLSLTTWVKDIDGHSTSGHNLTPFRCVGQ